MNLKSKQVIILENNWNLKQHSHSICHVIGYTFICILFCHHSATFTLGKFHSYWNYISNLQKLMQMLVLYRLYFPFWRSLSSVFYLDYTGICNSDQLLGKNLHFDIVKHHMGLFLSHKVNHHTLDGSSRRKKTSHPDMSLHSSKDSAHSHRCRENSPVLHIDRQWGNTKL